MDCDGNPPVFLIMGNISLSIRYTFSVSFLNAISGCCGKIIKYNSLFNLIEYL